MRYYTDKIDFRHEVTKEKFYSLKRRKNAHETICLSGDRVVCRILKFY